MDERERDRVGVIHHHLLDAMVRAEIESDECIWAVIERAKTVLDDVGSYEPECHELVQAWIVYLRASIRSRCRHCDGPMPLEPWHEQPEGVCSAKCWGLAPLGGPT